tara:strand:+ start:2017 stop:2214 length:198 start_codon:yes stop_codon:yes gene_type:complete
MKELTQNQTLRKATIQKHIGKTFRDLTHNEYFNFDGNRDWFVLAHEPDRFEEITPDNIPQWINQE